MSRCPACASEPEARFARPTGPTPCPILGVAEKPGQEEAYRGYVFQGDAGREMNETYLPLCGLDRESIRLTNTVRCRLGGTNSKPTAKQIEACASHHLPGEVERCQPECIVLLGASACSLVPSIELEKDHGMPVWIDSTEMGLERFFGDYRGWVWPINHPASALHSTGMMVPLLEDFTNFGLWRAGKWTPPTPDPNLPIDYRVLSHADEIEEQLADSPYDLLPLDTEDDCGRFWSYQFSPRPGAGYLVHPSPKLNPRFRKMVRHYFQGLLMHHHIHDLDVIEGSGLWAQGDGRVEDTMERAFILGNLPQGLKALGWRLAGVRMRSWEDVVMPYSRAKMITWLMQVWDKLSLEREVIEHHYKKAKKAGGKRAVIHPIFDERGMIIGRREYKPTKAERDCKRVLSHSHKPKYDIWKKAKESGLIVTSAQLEDWREKLDEELEESEGESEEFQESESESEGAHPILSDLVALAIQKECGSPPMPSIVHAPYMEAVEYGARDADMTGRVGLVLDERMRGITKGEWCVPPDDWDQ